MLILTFPFFGLKGLLDMPCIMLAWGCGITI
jgi:hypothetical protein